MWWRHAVANNCVSIGRRRSLTPSACASANFLSVPMKRLRCADASWCSKNRDTDRRRYVLYATNSQVPKMRFWRKNGSLLKNGLPESEKWRFLGCFCKRLVMSYLHWNVSFFHSKSRILILRKCHFHTMKVQLLGSESCRFRSQKLHFCAQKITIFQEINKMEVKQVGCFAKWKLNIGIQFS